MCIVHRACPVHVHVRTHLACQPLCKLHPCASTTCPESTSLTLPFPAPNCEHQDGSPSTWSAAELSDFLAVWRAISEDYAAYDVDVTTEDPGAAYLATHGVRAVIGGSAMGCKFRPLLWNHCMIQSHFTTCCSACSAAPRHAPQSKHVQR